MSKAAEAIPGELAGAAADRGLLTFLDRRINHDVQNALRRAWKLSVEAAFKRYVKESEAKFGGLHADERWWVEETRKGFVSDKTLEWLFPHVEAEQASAALIDAQMLPLADRAALTTRLRSALTARGLWTGLSPALDNLLDERLLPGVQFHFVEEIKRDTKARDGLFYRLFYQVIATTGATVAKLDLLLEQVGARLEELPGHAEYRKWERETLTAIHGDVKVIRGIVEGGVAPVWDPKEHVKAPPAPGYCFGREALVEDLVATLLADAPAPTLVLGTAGVGKSTVTRKALDDARVRERFGWRRFFVRCETAFDRATLAGLAAAAAGLSTGPDPEQRLIHALQNGERAVLVLDNLETPLEADAAETEDFLLCLAAVKNLALVVSLRGDRRPGAVTWRPAVEVEPLELAAARETFLANAKNGPQYAGDPLLNGLLTAVDCVPIAVTLLAKQVHDDADLRDLRRRWDEERTSLLRDGAGEHRLNNIEVSFKLSVDSKWMTPDARRLLCLLALLPGGMARADVRPVALPGGGDGAARSTLNQLGLSDEDGGARLRMLAPLREYVARDHPPLPDDHDRLTGHYLTLAEKWGWKVGTSEGEEAMRRLTPEAANTEAITLLALEQPAASQAIRAAYAMTRFIQFTSLGGTRTLERAEETARTSNDFLGQANCLSSLGDIALRRSDHDTARKQYEQAMPLYQQVGAVLGQANCLSSLGDIALARSDHDTARDRFQEALQMYGRIQEPYSIGAAHYHLAQVAPDAASRQGHLQAARDAWISIGREDLVQKYLDA